MERATPVRKSHTSTSDLLTWSEPPPPQPSPSADATSRAAARPNQPSDRIGKVLFGGQFTDEEAESHYKRKLSGYKLKEMTGSQIFNGIGEGDSTESGAPDGNFNNRTSVRIVQQAANGISQISFSTEERFSPKKPTSIPEVAKQRELSGTLQSDLDSRAKKQLSDAKSKELSGTDIFGPPPSEIPIRTSVAPARTLETKKNKDIGEPAPRNLRTSVKVSNPAGGHSNILFGDEPECKTTKKIHNQKFAELTGNDIFKGDALPGSAEKPLSFAKLKEMSGSDIFGDGKVQSERDCLRGVNNPPAARAPLPWCNEKSWIPS